MKILFCNIAYMLNYEGKTNRDITPTGAGQWVEDNEDAHEKWNFMNYDGYCYGFVQNKGKFRLERFEGANKNDNETDQVTIIWCAPIKSGKTVIVGWYENATLYRDYQDSVFTEATGLERIYFSKAKSEDCYLLAENLRTFEIGRASVEGAGRGFGQQNYWYAESDYARNELIPDVREFINKHKDSRINKVDNFFKEPVNIGGPLTQQEEEEANNYYNKGDYDLYLQLGYRSFNYKESSDEAFFIAIALKELYQFKESIIWFNKVIELEGETWDVIGNLSYLYEQVGDQKEAKVARKKLLKSPEGGNNG